MVFLLPFFFKKRFTFYLVRDNINSFIHYLLPFHSSALLSKDPTRLEVSYNSSGLLCHILSDGPSAWTITSVTRDECMLKIVSPISFKNLIFII